MPSARHGHRGLLTSALSSGVRFAELTTWPQHERDLAAETIYRFVFRSLYDVRAFNGDPHPGNYLFQRGGLADGRVPVHAGHATAGRSRWCGALLGDRVAAVHDQVLPGDVGRAGAGQPGNRGGDLVG